MKLLMFFLLAACLQVSANGFGQTVTLAEKNAPLEKVLNEIKKQSGFTVWYEDKLLEKAKPVSISVTNADLETALQLLFSNQPLSYEIVAGKIIAIKEREMPVNTVADPKPPPPVIDIRGRITDEEGNGVIATITVKGTNKAVTSDNEGYYILKGVDENATLVVSAVNIDNVEIKVGSRTFINIPVKLQVKELDAPIVVAYNTTTARSNVASLTVVKKEDFENIPVRSVDKALQGLVPGLLVTSGSGQPGAGLTNFVIRGISTLQDPFLDYTTVRNPLIVIDGVPVTQDNYQWAAGSNNRTAIINPMAQLNTEDFESITVLKDAAAIALYGSKASNGVILITTKKGKTGKIVVGFHSQADISTRLKGKVEWVNQQEYLDLVSETLRNTNPGSYPDEAAVMTYLKKQFPIRADSSLYPLTNWEDELYTKTAITSTNNLSFSGGNDKANFYLNLGYAKQNGVVKNSGFDQKSIRLNIESRPANWFKWGINTSLSYNAQDYGVPVGSNIGANPDDSPLNPIWLEDGSYFLTFNYPVKKPNPVAANEYNFNRNTSYRGMNKLNGEINFLKHFKFSSVFGVDFMLLEAKEIVANGFYNLNSGASDGSIRERDTRYLNLISTNQVSYSNRIKKNHSLNMLLGQEAQVMNTKILEGTGTKFIVPGVDQIFAAASRSSTGVQTKRTLLSWFGQANYGFKNRYFVSTSVRADGSSSFGERNRFGTFWSAGAGWIISEENFMRNASYWLSYLKLRGSIGAAGNSFVIDRYTRYDRLFYGTYLNSFTIYPDESSIPGNPDIQWERTFAWDAGLEARFWNNRMTFTADIYDKKTSNVVANISLPLVTGYQSVPDNIGNIRNTGIELSLALDIVKNRDFRWNLGANWSANKNTLISTSTPLSYIGSLNATPLVNLVGKPLNVFYLPRWAGVDPATGAAMWIDSTGKPSSNIAAAKPEFVGKPSPDGFGAITNSITYKNILVTVLFYYQYGSQIISNNGLINDGYNPFQNQDKRALDRWQKSGDITSNPIRIQYNASQGPSTRFLYKGDYIRFQTLAVGYTFSKKMLSRFGLNMLKVYAQVYNLAIWTKYPDYDPGSISPVGSMSGQYPNARSFSFGIDVNF